mmetsp:Transcript_20387/g.24499  ORF Transcript_20387/g.24499 Transcript_20387/m.24499 type:complete len:82 (+) Transcript_20387:293-538(+)
MPFIEPTLFTSKTKTPHQIKLKYKTVAKLPVIAAAKVNCLFHVLLLLILWIGVGDPKEEQWCRHDTNYRLTLWPFCTLWRG